MTDGWKHDGVGLAKDPMGEAIVAAATALIASGGRDALSARKLAAAVGASTKVIYGRFASMQAVIDRVYASAFTELAEALAAARDGQDDPAERGPAVMRAYRDFALASPARYELMYGLAAADLAPRPDDRLAAAPSLAVLASTLPDDDDAYAVWSAMHGAVSLELSGWLPDDRILQALVADCYA